MTAPSKDIDIQWAQFYLHAPGASVVVYEDGSIDTQQVQDKPLIGVYRLSRFADKAQQEQVGQEWTDMGLLPEQIEAVMARVIALPSPAADVQLQLDAAMAQYKDTLMEAQRRVWKSAADADTPVKPLPLLWLGGNQPNGTPVCFAKNHGVISVRPGTPAATLKTALDTWWKTIQPDYVPAGPKISAEDRAFPLNKDRFGEGNRGAGRKTPESQGKGDGQKKNTGAHVHHYRRQPIAERKLWVQDLLQDSKVQDMEFGDLMRWLRVISQGWSQKDMAKNIGVSSGAIGQVENFYSYINSQNMVKRYADFALGKGNPFLLPTGNTDGIALWARELIENKRDKRLEKSPHPLSPQRRDAALEQAEHLLSDYRLGRVSANELPNITDILNLILPMERKTQRNAAALALHVYGDEAQRDHLNNILCQRRNFKNEEIIKLAKYAGCEERYIPLLLRLPRGKSHYFADAFRLEMTEPEFKRVFSHPENYPHARAWLKALREARQMDREEVKEKMGGTSERIRQYESQQKISEPTIAKFLDRNPFDFAVDETGKVKADIADAFRRVMRGAPLKHYNLWPGFAQTFRELSLDTGHAATRKDISALIGDIQSQTAMDGGEGICDFTLDGRSYKARRTFNGELRFAPETVEALKTCPTIKSLRQAQHNGRDGPQRSISS